MAYGLVAPLYEMAKVCADQLAADEAAASTPARCLAPSSRSPASTCSRPAISPAARTARTSCSTTRARGVYKKLVLRDDRIDGAVLYGDAARRRLVSSSCCATRTDITRHPRHADVRPGDGGGASARRQAAVAATCPTPRSAAATASARAPSSRRSARQELITLDEVRAHTKASASCGSCTGLVEQLLASRSAATSGASRSEAACATARRLGHDEVRRRIVARGAEDHPRGHAGLELDRRPTAAPPAGRRSITICSAPGPANIATIRSRASSTSAPTPTSRRTAPISVVPRMWGGVTSAGELRAIADVVDKYAIPTVKVTGGQRIDLLGVKKEDCRRSGAISTQPASSRATPTARRCAR